MAEVKARSDGAKAPRHVAVQDPCPVRRLGLEGVLREAGFCVLVPGSLRPARAVRLIYRGKGQLTEALAADDGPAVVLVDELDAPGVHVALAAGATAVCAIGAEPEELVSVVDAAARGFTLLPVAVARKLGSVRRSGSCFGVRPCEAGWLRRLAAGASVRELADDHAFSEREMHRRLRALFPRLGAGNRAQAIARAVELGIVRADDLGQPDGTGAPAAEQARLTPV